MSPDNDGEMTESMLGLTVTDIHQSWPSHRTKHRRSKR